MKYIRKTGWDVSLTAERPSEWVISSYLLMRPHPPAKMKPWERTLLFPLGARALYQDLTHGYQGGILSKVCYSAAEITHSNSTYDVSAKISTILLMEKLRTQ